MFELIDHIRELMPIYTLVFCRLSALLISMPIFGSATISAKVRVMMAVALTMIIAPTLATEQVIVFESTSALVIAITLEILVGLLMGFGVQVIFESFSIAGSFIGMQMGMGIMQILDPNNQEQQPIISQFWVMLMIVVFIITNSHHLLVETLYRNFHVILPGTAVFEPALGRAIISWGSLMFELAIQFAAPALIFLILVDFALAFMARVMPQMNIFFISLPLKIGVGIVMLIISLNIVQMMFAYIIQQIESVIEVMLRTI